MAGRWQLGNKITSLFQAVIALNGQTYWEKLDIGTIPLVSKAMRLEVWYLSLATAYAIYNKLMAQVLKCLSPVSNHCQTFPRPFCSSREEIQSSFLACSVYFCLQPEVMLLYSNSAVSKPHLLGHVFYRFLKNTTAFFSMNVLAKYFKK